MVVNTIDLLHSIKEAASSALVAWTAGGTSSRTSSAEQLLSDLEAE